MIERDPADVEPDADAEQSDEGQTDAEPVSTEGESEPASAPAEDA